MTRGLFVEAAWSQRKLQTVNWKKANALLREHAVISREDLRAEVGRAADVPPQPRTGAHSRRS